MLNKFYKRPEIQKLAADHGLDGKKTNNWLTLPSNYPVLVEAFLKSVCHCVYLQHVSFTKPSSVLGSMFWRCLPSLLIFTSFSMTYAVEQVREGTLLQDQIRLRPFYQFTDLVSMFVGTDHVPAASHTYQGQTSRFLSRSVSRKISVCEYFPRLQFSLRPQRPWSEKYCILFSNTCALVSFR